METLMSKGIVHPSGEINKTKINLVAGAITQPFAEMLWATTAGDMDAINRLTHLLLQMNLQNVHKQLYRILHR